MVLRVDVVVDGTSPVFALMLAVVLAGIALGGLGAAAALRRWPRAPQAAPLVALLAGVTLVAGYATLPRVMGLLGERYLTELHEIAWPALHLMLPTCALRARSSPCSARRCAPG